MLLGVVADESSSTLDASPISTVKNLVTEYKRCCPYSDDSMTLHNTRHRANSAHGLSRGANLSALTKADVLVTTSPCHSTRLSPARLHAPDNMALLQFTFSSPAPSPLTQPLIFSDLVHTFTGIRTNSLHHG
jgi:hypothetical protein